MLQIGATLGAIRVGRIDFALFCNDLNGECESSPDYVGGDLPRTIDNEEDALGNANAVGSALVRRDRRFNVKEEANSDELAVRPIPNNQGFKINPFSIDMDAPGYRLL